jgi:hypothetical protein
LFLDPVYWEKLNFNAGLGSYLRNPAGCGDNAEIASSEGGIANCNVSFLIAGQPE